MSELKAYPGPYYLQPDCILDNHIPISVRHHGAFASVVVEMNDYGLEDEQAKKDQLMANACLLASARRLYDTLEQAVERMAQDYEILEWYVGQDIEVIKSGEKEPKALREARAALACARGEDPTLFSYDHAGLKSNPPFND